MVLPLGRAAPAADAVDVAAAVAAPAVTAAVRAKPTVRAPAASSRRRADVPAWIENMRVPPGAVWVGAVPARPPGSHAWVAWRPWGLPWSTGSRSKVEIVRP